MPKSHKVKEPKRSHKKQRGIQGSAEEINFDEIEDLQVFDGEESVPNNNVSVSLDQDESDSEADSDERQQQDDQKDQETAVTSNKEHFFGLLTRDELDYFKQAESMLNANSFGSSEERDGFITGVYEEAKGKAMKLATNQVCSKLAERLILTGTDEQVKVIFTEFKDHFMDLCLHKYASHCVESLIVRSASIVEREMLEPDNNSSSSAESLVLGLSKEINQYIYKVLAQDKYGSHVLRMLIVVLAGFEIPSPIDKTSQSALRSKKSKFARNITSIDDREGLGKQFYGRSYQVPATFRQAVGEIVLNLVENMITTAKAREFSLDKLTSPVMQLAMKAETSSKKKKGKDLKLCALLFNQDDGEEAYMEFLLSDVIGSHFLQRIIEESCLPSPLLIRLYKTYMEPRLDALARREFGSFAVIAVLTKLRDDEVRRAIDILTGTQNKPPLTQNKYFFYSQMFQRNNGSAETGECQYTDALITAVLDKASSAPSKPYKVYEVLSTMVFKKYGREDVILKNVGLDVIISKANNPKKRTSTDETKAVNLCNNLMRANPKVCEVFCLALLKYDTETLVNLGKHPILSHLVFGSLNPLVSKPVRSRLLAKLLQPGKVAELASNVYGSHIVDRLFDFTFELKHRREEIATELLECEEQVKHTQYGFKVYKNWSLDKYRFKRRDWWTKAQELDDKYKEVVTAATTTKKQEAMKA